MDIEFNGGIIKGNVDVPPSKSYTHRAFIMAALSGDRCVISNPLLSLDTKATLAALNSMGVRTEIAENAVIIDGSEFRSPDDVIDVANSGTTMRLMCGIASLFPSETVITGDDSIKKRPMGPLIDALTNCGVKCESAEGKAPIKITGPVSKDRITIDGSISSQFISSVLMMSPLVGWPMDIEITGNIVSRPYIEITLSLMSQFGIEVQRTGKGYHVEPQSYRPCDYRVPSDFSSAAFPLVAGGLGGSVGVDGLSMDDPQGDKKIVEILEKVGCRMDIRDRITCSSNGRIKGAEIDMSDVPDLFPVLAVLLCTAEGTSRLYGAPHLRFKESDRIAAVVDMLSSIGADIEGTDDGCVIRGVPRLRGGRIDHKGDHRLMMSAAIASIVSDSPIIMDNDSCWEVSFPSFIEKMRAIGLRC